MDDHDYSDNFLFKLWEFLEMDLSDCPFTTFTIEMDLESITVKPAPEGAMVTEGPNTILMDFKRWGREIIFRDVPENMSQTLLLLNYAVLKIGRKQLDSPSIVTMKGVNAFCAYVKSHEDAEKVREYARKIKSKMVSVKSVNYMQVELFFSHVHNAPF